MKVIFYLMFPSILLMFCACSNLNNNDKAPDDMPTILNEKLPKHPLLFFPAGQETEVLKKAEKNPLLSELIQTLRKEADKKLSLPPQQHTGDGKLLHVSREQISRVLTLSMAYRIFKDKKYAAKVEEELLNVCGFPNWSPSHFLDVAEMTTAVAIGYDWCYDYLSPATKQTVEKAIVEKAFDPAWPIYERDAKTPFNRENNWNTVCNAGMVNGALAIAEKYPAEAERIINYAVKYLPHLLESFAPEGVFNEGPGYWSYNGMFMALLFDNLNRIIKNDYGLPDYEGLDNTARFYISQVGATMHPFNFGDAGEGVDHSPTFFYLSKKYNQPDVAEYYRNLIKSALDKYNATGSFNFPRLFFLAIPWFDDSAPVKLEEKRLSVFKGVTDIVVFNGGNRSDGNRLHLAAKTGKGSWSHNQLDGGSFVLDCDGVRWGVDIGPDNYSLPNFWDYKPGGVRWNYFRNTNSSHSTLTIDNKITNSDGVGTIIKYNDNVSQAFSILDLSPYYPDEAVSVKRGIKLISPKTVLMRDEIELNPQSKEVSWRFVTNADVKIEGNAAKLSQSGKTFYVRCLLSEGFTMKSFPAKTYSDQEKPITNVNILEIKLNPSSRSVAIPVVLTNNINQYKPENEATLELKNWN